MRLKLIDIVFSIEGTRIDFGYPGLFSVRPSCGLSLGLVLQTSVGNQVFMKRGQCTFFIRTKMRNL